MRERRSGANRALDDGGTSATLTADPPLRGEKPRTGDDADGDSPLPAPLQVRDPDRYRILGEHARGGLGRIMRARDGELGREIAIKELLADDAVSEVRFFREALITARLEHPGIVPVYEAGRWPDGSSFYAMRMVSGRPLDDLLDEAPALSDRLAFVPNLIAVADAIAYAHQQGIVHRDLKPSNVMVGEFGETVVVDWGLAKAIDEPPDAAPDAPPAPLLGESVTRDGGAVGTPAYMAPEQFAGVADQRSDIYSLGGILHHILSSRPPRGRDDDPDLDLAPLPPSAPRDLAAIAGRAMARDPGERYASASELADDLRRFVRRQPVRARRYSLANRASLGVARHRGVALALVAAALAMAAVSIAWVTRLNAQRLDAERARDALVLRSAELLFARDPTEAAKVLDGYPGPDRLSRDLLLAQARGLGVARVTAAPHVRGVSFLAMTPVGIASVGLDQRVVLTAGDRSTELARDAARDPVAAAYATSGLLAYARRERGVQVVDLVHGGGRRHHPDMRVVAVAFSPDGARLALLEAGGRVVVASTAGGRDLLDVPADPARAKELGARADQPRAIDFADPDTLVVLGGASVRVFDLAGRGRSRDIAAARGNTFSVAAGRVAIGTASGALELHDVAAPGAEGAPPRTFPICAGIVTRVRLVSVRDLAAYTCQDGAVGAIDLHPGRAGRVVASIATRRPAHALTSTTDGRFLVIGNQSGDVLAHDLETGLTSTFVGHNVALTVVAAGSPGQLVSADTAGALRVWDTPPPLHRLVMRSGGLAIRHMAFSPDGRMLIADSVDGVVRVLELASGRVTELPDHASPVLDLRFSPGGESFVTWGRRSLPRRWNARDLHPAVLDVGVPIMEAGYLDERTVLTGDDDGRLIAWSAGQPRTLLDLDAAIDRFEVLARSGTVAIALSTGQVLLREASGGTRELLPAGDTVTAFRPAPDGHSLAVGTFSGAVHLVGPDRPSRRVLGLDTPIRRVGVSVDSSLLAAITEDGRVHLRSLSGGRPPWQEVSLRALSLEFSPDGRTLAITSRDGTLWFHTLATGEWESTHAHGADVLQGVFSPDGRRFASCDGSGTVLLRDLPAAPR